MINKGNCQIYELFSENKNMAKHKHHKKTEHYKLNPLCK